MSVTRRVILLGLAVFVGFIVYHAITPYGWSGDLRTPAGAAAQSASYTCGAPWGSGYVHGPTVISYPVTSNPCGQRGQYQIMKAVDVLLGVFAFAVVGGWARMRPRPLVSPA